MQRVTAATETSGFPVDLMKYLREHRLVAQEPGPNPNRSFPPARVPGLTAKQFIDEDREER